MATRKRVRSHNLKNRSKGKKNRNTRAKRVTNSIRGGNMLQTLKDIVLKTPKNIDIDTSTIDALFNKKFIKSITYDGDIYSTITWDPKDTKNYEKIIKVQGLSPTEINSNNGTLTSYMPKFNPDDYRFHEHHKWFMKKMIFIYLSIVQDNVTKPKFKQMIKNVLDPIFDYDNLNSTTLIFDITAGRVTTITQISNNSNDEVIYDSTSTETIPRADDAEKWNIYKRHIFKLLLIKIEELRKSRKYRLFDVVDSDPKTTSASELPIHTQPVPPSS